MSRFSPEIRHNQIDVQGHRCALLKLEVDVLQGHHCVPKCRGGSNNPINCVQLAGENAYCAYGVPVEDVHEICDRKALREDLYLHPLTLEFVPRNEMPVECFRNNDPNSLPEVKKSKYKKKKKSNRR